MGAGASKSTHDAKGRSKADQPIQREDTMRTMVKKAKKSEDDADTLFERIDKNGDGEISMIEVYYALATCRASPSSEPPLPCPQVYYALEKHGKAIQADWPTDRIKALIGKFDDDGNGYLNRKEFGTVLKTLGKEEQKKKLTKQKTTAIGKEYRIEAEASNRAATKVAASLSSSAGGRSGRIGLPS